MLMIRYDKLFVERLLQLRDGFVLKNFYVNFYERCRYGTAQILWLIMSRLYRCNMYSYALNLYGDARRFKFEISE